MFTTMLTAVATLPLWLFTLSLSLMQPLVLCLALVVLLLYPAEWTIQRLFAARLRGRARKTLWKRRVWPLLLATTLAPCLTAGLFWTSQFFVPFEPPPRAPATTLRIAHLNTWRLSSFISPKMNFIRHADADLISLVEVNAHLVRTLPDFKARYPYQAVTLPAPAEGLYPARAYPNALLSRWPLTTMQTWQAGIGNGDTPERNTLYRVERPGAPFYVLQVHPPSPIRPERMPVRNGIWQRLAHAGLPRPLIIVGDFNTVPWDPALTPLLQQAGQPLNIQGSWWPTFHSRWPTTPIDLLVASPLFGTATVHRQRVIDTDHLGVYFDFQTP